MKSQLKKKVVSERHLVLRMKRDLEKVLETVQPWLTKVQVLEIALEFLSKYADDVKFMLSRAEKLLALADINIFKFDCFRRQYENLRSRFHDKVRGVVSLLQGTPRTEQDETLFDKLDYIPNFFQENVLKVSSRQLNLQIVKMQNDAEDGGKAPKVET